MSQRIISSTQIDDTNPNVTYTGAAWTVHTNVQSIFHLYNDTDTFTDVQYAKATVRFYGNAIEYWGNRGPYHGPCQVSVDGNVVATVNSNAVRDDTPIMLYSNNQLSLGDHQLEVMVLNPGYPNVCEVDRFVANVTSNAGGNNEPNGTETPNNNGGSSSPPIAAIAGAVGGAAALCILLVGLWLYKRKKNNKVKNGAIITGGGAKLGKASAATKPLLADPPASPSPYPEKVGFGVPPDHSNQPSSYVSSSPPASSYNPPSTYVPSSYNPGSPPPSAAGFNPHMLAYNQGTMSPPPPSATTMTSMPNSPNTVVRPMSVVSSTSAAPTTSYYPSGAPTEAGNFPGNFPQPQQQQQQQYVQQHPQQQYQQPEQPQQQQYQQQGPVPVWATPEPPSSPSIPTHTQQPSVPSPTPTPAPVVNQPSPSPTPAPTSYPPEKAQYMPRNERAAYSGAQAESSTAGASSSSAPAASTAGASGSGQNADILGTAVPDLPPPAYQF